MKVLIISSLIIVTIFSGCCSSGKTSCDTKDTADSLSKPRMNTPVNVAHIAANSSNIQIKIDSVQKIDNYDFKLFGKVISEQNNVSENPTPDIGINIELIPDFFKNEENIIDYSHERNKRIMKLSAARIGDVYSIVISRDNNGTIHLIDLIEQ
ncbi:MAG: hypothetical protein HZB59_12295 [Ignavibacteriales bacterium]|nr:hypothetical protein [Ignavibacteriales bacterium]